MSAAFAGEVACGRFCGSKFAFFGRRHLSEFEFLREPISSIGDIAPLWQHMEQEGNNPFFTSWTWISTWLRCLPPDIRPELLVASRCGRVIGLGILVLRYERRHGVIRVRQLHFNATGDPALDCIMIEHNGFVGRGETSLEIWPAFLRWFSREARVDELVVPGVANDLYGLAIGKPRFLHSFVRWTAFACPLSQGGLEETLAGFSGNTRQQLRRNLRGWAELGPPSIEIAPSVESALAWFDEMKMLHIRYWTGKGRQHAFHYPFFETFHRALIAVGVLDGGVRMRRISAGSNVLGYLYDYHWRGTTYAYQSGFDDARPDLRPGYVSHLLAMEQDGRQGARSYDFLGGDNQLKRSLGKERYLLTSHRLGKAIPRLCLEAAVKSLRDRLVD